ncbi:MAG: hypothetical protein LBM19_04865 [Holosporales bacterium]|jgi:hypothetical protein|nr:hypothetical protein [Holosporales bacterium]
MKIDEIYSHLNGLEYIQVRLPELWEEINNIRGSYSNINSYWLTNDEIIIKNAGIAIEEYIEKKRKEKKQN